MSNQPARSDDYVEPVLRPRLVTFQELPGRSNKLPGLVQLARPHQWVKNLFLGVPLCLSPALVSPSSVGTVLLGICVFSLFSSAVYVLNDFSDRHADKLHPKKRNRPLASGLIHPNTGLLFAGLLLGLGTPVAFGMGLNMGVLCLVYLGLNIAYSFHFKHQAIIDVMLVAMCYVIRVYAGSWIIGIEPTTWLIIFTGLLALFIAFAKRRDDLSKSLTSGHRKSLAGYNENFLNTAIAITLGALVAIYCVYAASPEVSAHYATTRMHFTIPFVLAGVLRYLQASMVEEQAGEPTRFVLKDRFLMLCMVGWAATFSAVIYHWI